MDNSLPSTKVKNYIPVFPYSSSHWDVDKECALNSLRNSNSNSNSNPGKQNAEGGGGGVATKGLFAVVVDVNVVPGAFPPPPPPPPRLAHI